jgi:hypothetical protein
VPPSAPPASPAGPARPRWPRDDPPDGIDEVVERGGVVKRSAVRPPSLEIGRDATGPVIRPVRPPEATDG